MALNKVLVLTDPDSRVELRFGSFLEFDEWIREQGCGWPELPPEEARALFKWALDTAPTFGSFGELSTSLADAVRRCERWRFKLLTTPLEQQTEASACLAFLRCLNQTDSWPQWLDGLESKLVLRGEREVSVNGRSFLSWHRAAVYVCAQSMFRFLLAVNHTASFADFLSEAEGDAPEPAAVERTHHRIANLRAGLVDAWSLGNEIEVDWQGLLMGLERERIVFAGECSLEINGRPGTCVITEPQPLPEEPKVYCSGWPEILDALRLKNNQEERRRVQRSNALFGGPITVISAGSKPRVDKTKLIAWWNSLDDIYQDLQQRERDRQATVGTSYHYGSEGTVVPDLAGSVKKRRRGNKP